MESGCGDVTLAIQLLRTLAVAGMKLTVSKLTYMAQEGSQDCARRWRIGLCQEKGRLRQELLSAIHELVATQAQQTQAIIDDDPDFARFDVLLHMANERKENAKYALIAHIEFHHCEEA
jgi:hypothetical protein